MKDFYYYKPAIDPFETYELARKEFLAKRIQKENYISFLKRLKYYERRRSTEAIGGKS